MTDVTKRCVGCGNYKSPKEYYASGNVRHTDGLNPYCKHCCKVNRGSEAIRKRDRKSKLSVRQNYRATQLGLEPEKGVTLAKVYKQSAGMCGVCKKWVAPKHASMDHVIALINGGQHAMSNLQLTHLVCNLRKGRS
jgi:hypothetical protein